MIEIDVRAYSGMRLRILDFKGKLHAGPKQFLSSELFESSIIFRSAFLIRRIISRTIFTVGKAYRLEAGRQTDSALSKLPSARIDDNFYEIIRTGENAVRWDSDALSGISGIRFVQSIPCLTQGNTEYSLISGMITRLFENKKDVFFLQSKTYSEDGTYDIRYYKIPFKLADFVSGHCLPVEESVMAV